MKVARFSRVRPVLTVGELFGSTDSGPSQQVPTATGSNGNPIIWGSNVANIFSNTSNQITGPTINFLSGSGIAFAASSNTLTISATSGAGALAYGSNAARVAEIPSVGASASVARTDHIHDGIGTITASSSNTLQRGTVNLRAGAGIALSLTDTDGDGEFDTTTIVNTRAAGTSTSTGTQLGWYNVKDYGAAGDGVTDDTAEIQAAIDAVPSYSSGMGGAVVYLPAGKYIVSSTLTIPAAKSGITILGAGEVSTWILGTVAGAPVLSTFYDGTANVYLNNVTIEGMTLYNASSAASSCGLRVVQAGPVNVKQCQIETVAAYPALVCDSGYLYYFNSCSFQSAAYGTQVGLNGLGGVNVVHFLNCSWVAGTGGAHIVGAAAVLFSMCHFEGLSGGSSASAIFLNSCIGVQISSCYFENAGDYCVRTSAAAFGTIAALTVQGCYMYDAKVGLIDLTDCTSSVILPNIIRPGPNNTNATGITGITNASQITVMPQSFQDMGSGAAVNTSNYNQHTVGFGPYNTNGAPLTSLNNIAEKGALVIDYTNGKLYINTGTKASNTWTVVGTQT